MREDGDSPEYVYENVGDDFNGELDALHHVTTKRSVRLISTDQIFQLLTAEDKELEGDVRELIEHFDEDEDGYVTVREFIRLLQKVDGVESVDVDSLPKEWLQTVFESGENAVVLHEALNRARQKRLEELTGVISSRTKLSATETLLSGAVAGGMAKTTIAPGDRVKLLYQVDPTRHFTLRKAVKSLRMIVHNEGFLAMWRGNGAMMVRVIPHAALIFWSFDMYEQMYISSMNRPMDTFSRFCAGAAAGTTATCATYPLDLMRARLAAQWGARPKYTGFLHTCTTITREEGVVALYKGIRPTLLGIIPYAGLSFMVFETLKPMAAKAYFERFPAEQEHTQQHSHHHKTHLPAVPRLACGAFAGLVAQSATYPLDIVRRRMQVDASMHTGEPLYRNVWHAVTEIYQQEGLRKGLYKGLSMNWIKGPIAVSISFTVNDMLKRVLRERREDMELDA